MGKPIDFNYLYEDQDRHGNWRLYVRLKPIGKVRIRANRGTEAFIQEYHAGLRTLREKAAARAAGSETELAEAPESAGDRLPAPPGSLSWLIERYYASGEFKQLEPRTRHVRQLILDKLRARKAGGKPYRRMEAPHVAKLRDEKIDFPEAANGIVKALRQVFKWAKLPHVALATTNPAAAVPYLAGNQDGHHSWTIEEVEAFEDRHAPGSKARLALALLLYTGVRRSDVVKLGRQHLRNGWLTFDVTKGNRRNPRTLTIPVLPPLQAEIDAATTGQMTFLMTAFGKPYTPAGFGNWFRRRCDEAGLDDCSAHGLRKAGAALAAEGGATERQLMAVFGWETMKEAERYTRKARQKVLAGQATQMIEQARNSNRRDPPAEVVTPGGSLRGKKVK